MSFGRFRIAACTSSRTFPASGRFTSLQRRIYEWVSGRAAEPPVLEPPAHTLALYD